MRHARRLLAAIACGLPPAIAAASPGAVVALDWQAPPGCPAEADMRAWIAEAAGTLVTRGLAASARVERFAGGEWGAVVRVRDDARDLHGVRCEEVARAAALVIGLALRAPPAPSSPSVALDEERPAGLTLAIRSSVAASTASLAAPPDPTRAVRVALAAAAGGSVGATAGPVLRARAGLWAIGQRSAAGLELEAARGQRTVAVDRVGDVALRVELVTAGTIGCRIAERLWLCGGVEIGQASATASAGAERSRGSGLWAAAMAGPSLSLPVTRAIDLSLGAELAVPLLYPRFSINDVEVPTGSPAAVRAGLGLRCEIW